MRTFLEIAGHSLIIIWGIIMIIISNKLKLKKQKKGYEINPEIFNNIINNAIRRMGHISIIYGFIVIFHDGIIMSITLPIGYFIINYLMADKIKRLAREQKKIDKLV